MPSQFNRRFAGFIGCVIMAGAAAPAAIYVIPEIRQVPVARLIANLERQVDADPGNGQTHINLARLHGMAFALAAEEVPAVVAPGTGEERPWYGHEPDLIPYRAKRPAPGREAAAREHLRKAIELYETALRLDPSSLMALLGCAWTLDQAGETQLAIEKYRQVIASAWTTERNARRAGIGQRFFTAEAAEYLIPHLDRNRDAAEIADLRARREQLAALPRPITPLAIPLQDDLPPAAVLDQNAQVLFDADGSGLPRRWSWIRAEVGWLVYAENASGLDTGRDDGRGERPLTRPITSALQLFGNVTFWLFWENGYDALSALDDNGDGELTGEELRHVAIWHDRNGDGVADPGEVRSLARHGVVALSCRYAAGDGVSFAAVSPAGARYADGRVRPTYDVILSGPFHN